MKIKRKPDVRDRIVSVAAALEYARYHGQTAAKRSQLWAELGRLLEQAGARYACPRCDREASR